MAKTKDLLEELDDRELMGLIHLLNELGDKQGGPPTLHHPKMGSTSAMPLLRRLLSAAVSRGLMHVPSCYRGPKL